MAFFDEFRATPAACHSFEIGFLVSAADAIKFHNYETQRVRGVFRFNRLDVETARNSSDTADSIRIERNFLALVETIAASV